MALSQDEVKKMLLAELRFFPYPNRKYYLFTFTRFTLKTRFSEIVKKMEDVKSCAFLYALLILCIESNECDLSSPGLMFKGQRFSKNDRLQIHGIITFPNSD